MKDQIECIYEGVCHLGECPVWNVKEKKLYWSEKYETRRIIDCIYFKDKNIIAIKSLTPKDKKKSADEKYSLVVISLKNGQVLGELVGISNINKIESNLLVEIDSKLIEYSIK